MSSNNNKKKYGCPSSALFHPSRFRGVYFPISLVVCWAAVFFKARAMNALPWSALLLSTIFVSGIVAAESFISARFSKYLALAIYGFLFGAGINVIIQALLNRLQGLNWAFQSPILFSLGALLLGFLGTLVFTSHGEGLRKIFPPSSFLQARDEFERTLRTFLKVLWIITFLVALAFCINLVIIIKFFSGIETSNPLRKPLWFSVGAIVFIFVVAVFARRNLLRLGQILLPGIIVGLIWTSIIKDLFMCVYIKHAEFPISMEVLEVLLVINFCFLGTAWLNRAAYDSQ